MITLGKTPALSRRALASTIGVGVAAAVLGAGGAEAAPSTKRTRAVARRWFTALTSGDTKAAIATLAPEVEWINYTVIPGYNDDMPWIGTYRGVDAVVKTFDVFGSVVEVLREELVKLVVEGDQAAGVIHEISKVRKTGMEFEIEFIQWLTVRGDKIVRWKSYTDPSPIIRAMRGG